MSITREMISEMLATNDFVAITYAKVNGEVTTRLATVKHMPGTDAPKGNREMSEDNYRYFEWGAKNRFDADSPGDWKSCKIANIKAISPAAKPE